MVKGRRKIISNAMGGDITRVGKTFRKAKVVINVDEARVGRG